MGTKPVLECARYESTRSVAVQYDDIIFVRLFGAVLCSIRILGLQIFMCTISVQMVVTLLFLFYE